MRELSLTEAVWIVIGFTVFVIGVTLLCYVLPDLFRPEAMHKQIEVFKQTHTSMVNFMDVWSYVVFTSAFVMWISYLLSKVFK